MTCGPRLGGMAQRRSYSSVRPSKDLSVFAAASTLSAAKSATTFTPFCFAISVRTRFALGLVNAPE